MIRFTMIGSANTFRRADSAGVTAFCERGMPFLIATLS
jgi:hypothetical protein